MNNKPIIPIKRVSEATIEFLIKIGILYVDESGLHVIDVEQED